jgi:NADPH:quinone reductase-like Zn-dependent oxidoreductase
MKVAEYTGPGLDSVRIADREEARLAANHVRVKVSALSLNHRDVLMAKGMMPMNYPVVALSDAAGTVVEVGPGVTRVALGDRVCPIYYPDWISGDIEPWKWARDRGGAGGDGVAADYLSLSEQELVKVPEHLTDLEAASLPCAGVTAWSAVTKHASLKPGSSVLVQGTGGVSLFAAQFALAAGAEVLLISSSNDKLARARGLGVHHTLNYRETPDWSAWAVERTGGRGVDLVVDVVGGSLEQSIGALATGGHISQVGVIAGLVANVPIYPLMTRELHVNGVISGSREDAEAMLRGITQHKIHPVIDNTFELKDLSKALQHLEDGGHFGKVTVNVG